MLDMNTKSFESVVEIYGGFPLKEDFLEIGNAALAEYGVKAELEDGVIRIPFLDKQRYTLEELREFWPEDEDDPDDWRVLVAACIELSDEPAEGVVDSYYEYEFVFPDDVDDDSDYEVTKEEYDRAIALIETFLNATVDCGE